MKHRIINIFTNETEISLETKDKLTHLLIERGYTVTEEFTEDAMLIVCIGGDGAFLEAVHKCKFPHIPFIGINTGHLGFFQEISPDKLEQFITDFENGEYSLQKLSTVCATVTTASGHEYNHIGLNEIILRGRQSYAIHFQISIGDQPIERFSGDGILVATSSGSTAYNYSLGGSIVDPRLDLLQVTPMAPMNTTAYRSFTSSILLPAELSLGVVPEQEDKTVFVNNDGIETGYFNVKEIKVSVSDTFVYLMRFKDYDFWNKVKTKFL